MRDLSRLRRRTFEVLAADRPDDQLSRAVDVIIMALVALPTSIIASGFAHVMNRNERTLENEAMDVLADGVITRSEALHYSDLADSLYIEPEIAGEIIEAVQKRQALEDLSARPHCGKSITD